MIPQGRCRLEMRCNANRRVGRPRCLFLCQLSVLPKSGFHDHLLQGAVFDKYSCVIASLLFEKISFIVIETEFFYDQQRCTRSCGSCEYLDPSPPIPNPVLNLNDHEVIHVVLLMS